MPPNNPFMNQPGTPGAPAPTPVTQAPLPVTPIQAAPPIAQQAANLGSGASQQAKTPVKNPNSTQNTLQLSEVRDNMVVMIDGSLRAVVACKSINFDLMSQAEREGVEFSYQSFLNSLNFPVQIVVRSQRVDIGPYIEKLLNARNAQDNMLLGVLMDDYITFMDRLSQEANIMAKSFFVVVPFYPAGDLNSSVQQAKGFFSKLFAAPKNTITKIDKAAYQKAKDEIANRVDSVMSGLFQIGVQAVQLNTKELGELYYNFYNPDTAVREPLGNYEDITSTYVRKAESPAQNPGGAA